MADIIPVYIVRGDFAGVGDGKILGIFSDLNTAKENATDCGSMDCGGDGMIDKGHAIVVDKEIYLLQSPSPMVMDLMSPSEAKRLHQPVYYYRDGEESWCTQARLEMMAGNRIPALRIIRQNTHLSLKDARNRLDEIMRHGD